MRARRAALLALVPLATAVGCGGDSDDSSDSSDSKGSRSSSGTLESQSPEQILEKTAAALARVKTFHVEGTEGSKRKETKVSGDIGLPQKLRLAIEQGDESASFLIVNGSLYVKANRAFWKGEQTGKAAEELADRWLKTPTSTGEVRDLTKELDPANLSRCLLKEHGTLSHGGKATVDGRPAVVIVDKGDRPGTAPGKLFVAAEGQPLPLRALTTGKERPGGKKDPSCSDEDDTPAEPGDEVTFSRFGEPLNISAPPAAVDLGSGTAS